MIRCWLALTVLLAFCGGIASNSNAIAQSSQPIRMAASKLAREEGMLLLKDWLHIRGSESIDGLAWRTMAFAGLVPDVDVILDGHRMSAKQALLDSALTLVDSKTIGQDANALRNITYALSLIVDGRTVRPAMNSDATIRRLSARENNSRIALDQFHAAR